uniref:Uncharacterized protein n=1 Tax=Anguilla anguilla TaxID=7936 RepID=A0A0E9TPN5_ANGAN
MIGCNSFRMNAVYEYYIKLSTLS